MKQKFRKLTFVKIIEGAAGADGADEGIIDSSYSQAYGGDDIASYSIYTMSGGEINNRVAWFYESQLTQLPNQDREKAEEMIEAFNLES